jgi:hypothetical protein
MRKLYLARLCTLLLPLALAACGGGASVKAPANDSALEKRSVERWNLLIAHKAEKAYDYLSPGTRSTETREKYAADMNNRPVHWQSVTYVDRKCDDPTPAPDASRYSVNTSARMGQTCKRQHWCGNAGSASAASGTTCRNAPSTKRRSTDVGGRAAIRGGRVLSGPKWPQQQPRQTSWCAVDPVTCIPDHASGFRTGVLEGLR